MTNNQREIRCKLRILQHAEKIGSVSKTCRYFGIGRASFYRRRKAFPDQGSQKMLKFQIRHTKDYAGLLSG